MIRLSTFCSLSNSYRIAGHVGGIVGSCVCTAAWGMLNSFFNFVTWKGFF